MAMKWLLIAWAIVMLGMFVGASYEARTKADCRTAYAQSTKTAEEIKTICGK